MRREPGSDPVNDPTLADTIRVVPATPEPVYEELPTAAMPVVAATYVEPPVVAASYVAAPAVLAVAPEPVYYAEPPQRRWGAVAAAAILALLVGGIIGLLIGRAGAKGDTLASTDTLTTDTVAGDQAAVDRRVNDIFTLLVAESHQPGGIGTPTPYPQLDQLIGILQGSATPASTSPSSTATDQAVGSLTDQVTLLQQQNTDLQAQLATAQQQRDALQATLDSSGGATSDLQRQADEQAQKINQLQSDLDATNAKLATAQDTLTKLNAQPIDNLVGMDIAQVRSLAKTNGWTLVEKTVDNTGATPNSVTAQTPAPGTTMITGGVLYVEVAKKP